MYTYLVTFYENDSLSWFSRSSLLPLLVRLLSRLSFKKELQYNRQKTTDGIQKCTDRSYYFSLGLVPLFTLSLPLTPRLHSCFCQLGALVGFAASAVPSTIPRFHTTYICQDNYKSPSIANWNTALTKNIAWPATVPRERLFTGMYSTLPPPIQSQLPAFKFQWAS